MISATIEIINMFAFKIFLTFVFATGFNSAVHGRNNDTLPALAQTIFGATGLGLGKSDCYIILLYITQCYIIKI